MLNGQRLDGWKAIANYLGRERTTAIRWAKERGLPVHRVPGGQIGTVYALRTELDAWLDSDGIAPKAQHEIIGHDHELTSTADPHGKRPVLAGLAMVSICLLVATWWMLGRTPAKAKAPVSIAAVASRTANPETIQFGRALTADLARFANASATLAIFEREPGAAPGTEYAVRTEIERANGNLVVQARLVAVNKGEILWSRRYEQAGPALSALRERVAADIIGVLRCSFGGLEDERSKARSADLAHIMAVCQAFEDDDQNTAKVHARQLTVERPNLALGWALLAIVQSGVMEESNYLARTQARMNAARAFEIAPGNVVTSKARAAVAASGFVSIEALAIIDNALKSHPDHPWLLSDRSMILFNLGYVKASVAPALNAYRNDPSSLFARDIAVRRLAAAGRVSDALRLQNDNERLWPDHPVALTMRTRLISDIDATRKRDLEEIQKQEREVGAEPYVAYTLARINERTGNRRAALAWLARAPVKDANEQWSLLFWPDTAGLRTEPAFFLKMAELGLVRWWVTRGEWPDFCAEPNLKYACASEADKLQLRKPKP